MVARYGGEEFATLLVGCSQAEAVAILDRMRAATPPRSRWGGDRSPSSIGAG
jgi:GGDEF domain-containing protein